MTPDEERFWRYVDDAADGCRLWTGAISRSGYGAFDVGGRSGRTLSAHRFAFTIQGGELAPGQMVLHTCDVKLCVAREHLYAGSAKDNARDAIQRGQLVRGEAVHSARLTAEDVQRIRQRYTAGDVTQYELAAEYGVTQGAISHILLRRNWRHV